jgi:hypothetical protein
MSDERASHNGIGVDRHLAGVVAGEGVIRSGDGAGADDRSGGGTAACGDRAPSAADARAGDTAFARRGACARAARTAHGSRVSGGTCGETERARRAGASARNAPGA